MKSKKLIFYSGLLITSCGSYVYGMHELVKKEIDKVEQQFSESTKGLSFDECDIFGYFDERRRRLAVIARSSGELMTDTEKLDHLLGDSFFEERKKIIITMVDEKKINPNQILYQERNPLSEAVMHKNIDFTKYLLEKGATPNKETIELMLKDSKFAVLLSS